MEVFQKYRYPYAYSIYSLYYNVIHEVPACMLSCFSCLTLLGPSGLQLTRLLCPWDFSRQEYQSELPCPPPWTLHDPGSNLHLLCFLNWQVNFLPLAPSGKLPMNFLKDPKSSCNRSIRCSFLFTAGWKPICQDPFLYTSQTMFWGRSEWTLPVTQLTFCFLAEGTFDGQMPRDGCLQSKNWFLGQEAESQRAFMGLPWWSSG